MASSRPQDVTRLRALAGVRPGTGQDDEVEIPVQINGKVKAKLVVPTDADAATLEKIAAGRSQGPGANRRQNGQESNRQAEQMVSIVIG